MSSNEPVKNGCEVIYEMFHILNCGFEIYETLINCIYFCNQLSVGYVTKTGNMTTSVRFTGVPAQSKMNTLFICHRNVFLLNLIDHAVD